MTNTKLNYHDRPEWSYSSMKKIIDSGIDYAVGAKRGMLPPPQSQFIDLGQLAHMICFGGDDTFAISEFPDFRTKAAQEWRDEQLAAKKNIITKAQFEAADQIVKNIENHPHTEKYLLGKGFMYEQEMFAKTSEGVDLRGKGDSLNMSDKKNIIITDLKTTAQFDKFKKSASWQHYDLQAAVYTLITALFAKVEPEQVTYMFCVAETVAPYRVQYFHASNEFLEAGERKLRTCIDAILSFGKNDPNFLIEEIGELGDWSL
ncbi:MAG: PD-(D/E)XK nuclease-like domain-containing protein [Sulfuriferula sp.]